MAAQAQISVHGKVNELIYDTKWSSLKTSRPDGVLSGMYVIGQNTIIHFEEQGYEVQRTQYLYLGQSANIARRLNECYHKSKEYELIRKYIRNEDEKGRQVLVKWIEEPNHKLLEGEYLKKLEMELGYELPFNIQRGNGINPKRGKKRIIQGQPSVKNYFHINQSDVESENAEMEVGCEKEDKQRDDCIIQKANSSTDINASTSDCARQTVAKEEDNDKNIKPVAKEEDNDKNIKPVARKALIKQLHLSFEKISNLNQDDDEIRSPWKQHEIRKNDRRHNGNWTRLSIAIFLFFQKNLYRP